MKRDYTLVIDIRGLGDSYADVEEFIWGLSGELYQEDVGVIIQNKLEEEILLNLTYKRISAFGKLWGIKKVMPKVNYTSLNIKEFDEFDPDNTLRPIWGEGSFDTWLNNEKPNLPDHYKLTQYTSDQEAAGKVKSQEDFMIYSDAVRQEYRIALLHKFINKNGRNSMLNEYAFTINKDKITVVPYHSHALYKTYAPEQSQSIIARPGVIARRTGSILLQELRKFEAIINKPKVKENEIQKFLEQHNHFFHGLNYKNVYPQLMLERPAKGKLVPDFICEPIGSEWCEILDLKIPITKPIDVGGEDRARLSVVIADGVAQLREYAAWFEDEQNFKSFRKKYGLSVYRPRLKLIVGRDPRSHDKKQLRRMMTAYSGIDILTYDQFLRICKSRLLI